MGGSFGRALRWPESSAYPQGAGGLAEGVNNLRPHSKGSYLLVLLIAGCASQPTPPAPPEPEWVWQKAGASTQDFSVDRGQCQAQALSVSGLNYFQIAGVFIDCMNGKGWQHVPKQP
jgi:hypothetical protein